MDCSTPCLQLPHQHIHSAYLSPFLLGEVSFYNIRVKWEKWWQGLLEHSPDRVQFHACVWLRVPVCSPAFVHNCVLVGLYEREGVSWLLLNSIRMPESHTTSTCVLSDKLANVNNLNSVPLEEILCLMYNLSCYSEWLISCQSILTFPCL